MGKYLWLLDAGHGGIINGEYQTPGKRSPMYKDSNGNDAQFYEGVFNREIVKKIIALCNNKIDTYNLTDTEMDLALRERTDLANEIFRKHYQTDKKPCIFLSVHANAFTPNNKLEFNSAKGWEVYTTKGETVSDKIATIFFDEMKKQFPGQTFRTEYSDQDPDKEEDFFVLRKTAMPAVLTENFFMTNKDDLALLLNEDVKNKIAQVHFNAMMEVEDKVGLP
jgi:N-acetylmuramoyl-L-alanine amidase